ncbi:MAG: hypothetical protein ACLFO2_02325 [Candidatus Woesearchaeota archaeon]
MSDTPQQRKETFLEEVQDLVEKYVVRRVTFRKNNVLKNYELHLTDESIKKLLGFAEQFSEEGPTGINLDGLYRWTHKLWDAQTPAYKGIRADEQGPAITKQDMKRIDNTIFGKHTEASISGDKAQGSSQPSGNDPSQTEKDGLKEWKHNTSPEQRKKEFLKDIQSIIETYLIGDRKPSSQEIRKRFGLHIPDIELWEKKPKKNTTYLAWLRKNIPKFGYTDTIKKYVHQWIIQGVWLQQPPAYRITQDNTLKDEDIAPIDVLLTRFANKAQQIAETERTKGGFEKNAEHAEDYNPSKNEKKDDEEETNQEGLFFYTWWAFKDESIVKDLNDKSRYPRRIGKGSRPRYEEEPTKDKNVMDTNEKPHGEAVDAVYLGIGGTTRSEVPFEDSEKIPPQELEGFPVVGLGVAIAQRKDFPEPISFKTMNTKRKDQIIYEFLPKEDLRWKWQWRRIGGKKKRKVKVKVVDNDKVMGTHQSLDLYTLKQALTDEQLKTIMDDKTLGVEGATVTLHTDAGSTSIGKTVKDGILEIDSDKVPAGGFWPIAKKNSWTGINDDKNAKAVHPWPPGSQLVLKEDLIVIIPMDADGPKKPELRITIANNDDHPRPKEKKWGQDRMASFEPGKTENSQHVFQLIGTNVSNLKNKPSIICYVVKLNDSNKKVNRTKPPFDKIAQVERQDIWQSYFVTKKGDSASQWKPFNNYHELSKQMNNTIIATSITVPGDANGKYAIWAFLTEGQPEINNFKDLTDRSLDFNYYEFKVDNGKMQSDSRAKKSEKQASKDIKNLGEEFQKLAEKADKDSRVTSFSKKEKQHCASMLDDIITFQKEVASLVRSDPSQIGALKSAVSLGLWAREAEDKKAAKDVPDKTLKSLVGNDKGLKGLQEQLRANANMTLDFGDAKLKQVHSFGKDHLMAIKTLLDNMETFNRNNNPITPAIRNTASK